MICSMVLHHSIKIFVHGEINFHTIMLNISSSTLAVTIQVHPELIRRDHSVLLNVNNAKPSVYGDIMLAYFLDLIRKI